GVPPPVAFGGHSLCQGTRARNLVGRREGTVTASLAGGFVMGGRRSGFRTRIAVIAAAVGVVAGTAWAGLASAGPAAAFAFANVPCSGVGGGAPGLVAAINAANGGGGGFINLAPGCTYLLTQVDNMVPDLNGSSSNGLPVITSPIILNGSFTTIER